MLRVFMPRGLLVLCSVWSGLTVLPAWADESNLPAIREAIEKKQGGTHLITLLRSVQQGPLKTYPQYWLLSKSLKSQAAQPTLDPVLWEAFQHATLSVETAARRPHTRPPPPLDRVVADFLARNEGSLLADRLRADWLHLLSRQGRWADFAREWPRLIQWKPGSATHCESLRYAISQQATVSRPAYADARDIWFGSNGIRESRQISESCWLLFDLLKQKNLLGETDVWRKVRLAFAAKNPELAKQMNDYLSQSHQLDLKTVDLIGRGGWLLDGAGQLRLYPLSATQDKKRFEKKSPPREKSTATPSATPTMKPAGKPKSGSPVKKKPTGKQEESAALAVPASDSGGVVYGFPFVGSSPAQAGWMTVGFDQRPSAESTGDRSVEGALRRGPFDDARLRGARDIGNAGGIGTLQYAAARPHTAAHPDPIPSAAAARAWILRTHQAAPGWPASFLARLPLLSLDNPAGEALGIYALLQLATRDLDLAADLLPRTAFLPETRRYLWSQLGRIAYFQMDARAAGWFAQGLVPAELDTGTRAAWVRTLLRRQDWAALLTVFDAMPAQENSDDSWQYWRGMAYLQTQRLSDARMVWSALAHGSGYYNLLAQEGIHLETQLNFRDEGRYHPSDAELMQIRQLPAVQRALALYTQGRLHTDAVAEWNWAMRTLSDQQLLAAAEIARQAGWYSRAIYAAERTRDLHDFSLRFLTPYRDPTTLYAQNLGLDEAWVYGLIRQESRFLDSARSVVGARGLMQLMPATARWVAQQIGLRHVDRTVHDVDVNIQLGTYFLRHVLDQLGSQPVLATAAYNAGPSRALAWCSTVQPMDARIYIESIPFTETRGYVRNVMANAVYYARSLGRGETLLSRRIGTIPSCAQLNKKQIDALP